MRRLESNNNVPDHGRPYAGFSLIELLVVVAVILIIAAIAIPNFIASKMRANEASAVQNMRSITTSELVYSSTYSIGFSADLTKLSGNGILVDQNHAGLIDSVLASGYKSGYNFTYTVLTTDANGNASTYSLTGDPKVVGNTGQKYFYADQTGVIHFNVTGPAGQTDPAIQ